MYCDYFGFKEFPFALTPNPRFIFLSKFHREAFAHLLYGIDSHAGFIELTGEVGSGKTTILRALLGQLDDAKHRTALIFNPRLSADELLRTINREFGISHSGSIDELIHALNQFLLQENAANRTVVLVIDEAQNLDPVVLEQIRMLSNLETDTIKLIQIVLAGQPELCKMLESDNLRQLSQRITVRFHLHPLDFEDMRSYIDHRLEIAGGWRAVTFTPSAFKKIFRHTKGLPRLINVICDRALLIGFTEETREITPKMVAQAVHELKRPSLTASEIRNRKIYGILLLATSLTATITILASALLDKQISPSNKPSSPAASAQLLITNERTPIENLSLELGKQKEIATALQGFNELAKLWNVRPVVGYAGKTVQAGLERISARRGLRLLTFTGSITELLQADAPCILELWLPGISGNRYLALTGHRAGSFFIEPVSQANRTLNETDLKSIWTGRAFIPWRNTHNLPESVELGSKSQEISRMQLMLAEAGTFIGKPTGTFDQVTQDAIKKFQLNQRLSVDGIPGPRTLLMLYHASGTENDPKLTGHGRSDNR